MMANWNKQLRQGQILEDSTTLIHDHNSQEYEWKSEEQEQPDNIVNRGWIRWVYSIISPFLYPYRW